MYFFLSTRSDDEESDYEISDQDVYKLLIVTQSPPSAAGGTANTAGPANTTGPAANTSVTTRPPKHGGYDRTGDWTSRTKITQELAKVINDGLYYYEQDLWEGNEWVRNKLTNVYLSFTFSLLVMFVLKEFSILCYSVIIFLSRWKRLRKICVPLYQTWSSKGGSQAKVLPLNP